MGGFITNGIQPENTIFGQYMTPLKAPGFNHQSQTTARRVKLITPVVPVGAPLNLAIIFFISIIIENEDCLQICIENALAEIAIPIAIPGSGFIRPTIWPGNGFIAYGWNKVLLLITIEPEWSRFKAPGDARWGTIHEFAVLGFHGMNQLTIPILDFSCNNEGHTITIMTTICGPIARGLIGVISHFPIVLIFCQYQIAIHGSDPSIETITSQIKRGLGLELMEPW